MPDTLHIVVFHSVLFHVRSQRENQLLDVSIRPTSVVALLPL